MKTKGTPLHHILRQINDPNSIIYPREFATAVYEQMLRPIRCLISKYCPNKADDIAHDFFFKKFFNRDNFKNFPSDSERHLKNFIFKMARNYCLSSINIKRDNMHHQNIEDICHIANGLLHEEDPGVLMDYHQMLDRLSERERLAFLYCVIRGIPQEEACEMLDTSIAGVRNLIYRVKKKIMAYFL